MLAESPPPGRRRARRCGAYAWRGRDAGLRLCHQWPVLTVFWRRKAGGACLSSVMWRRVAAKCSNGGLRAPSRRREARSEAQPLSNALRRPSSSSPHAEGGGRRPPARAALCRRLGLGGGHPRQVPIANDDFHARSASAASSPCSNLYDAALRFFARCSRAISALTSTTISAAIDRTFSFPRRRSQARTSGGKRTPTCWVGANFFALHCVSTGSVCAP